MKLKRIHEELLEDRLSQIYHTGSTTISTWELLHWFQKDGGRITKAFFRDEIVSRWQDFYEDDAPELSVLTVRADYNVTKPSAYIVFRDDFLFRDGADEE